MVVGFSVNGNQPPVGEGKPWWGSIVTRCTWTEARRQRCQSDAVGKGSRASSQRGTVNRARAERDDGFQCGSGQQCINQRMQEAWRPLVSNEYKPEFFYSQVPQPVLSPSSTQDGLLYPEGDLR